MKSNSIHQVFNNGTQRVWDQSCLSSLDIYKWIHIYEQSCTGGRGLYEHHLQISQSMCTAACPNAVTLWRAPLIPLSPMTERVLSIGFASEDGKLVTYDQDRPDKLGSGPGATSSQTVQAGPRCLHMKHQPNSRERPDPDRKGKISSCRTFRLIDSYNDCRFCIWEASNYLKNRYQFSCFIWDRISFAFHPES